MRGAPGLATLGLATVLGLVACAGGPTTVDAARARNLEYVEGEATALGERHPERFVVIQRGGLAAAATAADDAVRAAERREAAPLHRYVFRPGDEGKRAYRMTFLPTGGVVVGRRFFEAFRARASWRPGKPLVVERLGTRRELDLEQTPRLGLIVETLDREQEIVISAVMDLDFDGALLIEPATAEALGLERFEIPGDADVQVALGRPFRARRALALVHVPLLQLDAVVEIAFETAPDKP